jgi:hypothetical protein
MADEIIFRNSAKCTACNVEIVSRYRHDFAVHFCKKEPRQARKWVGEGANMTLVDVPGEYTWRFAVDGGREYLKRCGDSSSYIDTSIVRPIPACAMGVSFLEEWERK